MNKISYRAMKVGKTENSVTYRFPCDCHDPDCDFTLDFELDKDYNIVIMTIYKNLIWTSYRAESWYEKLWLRFKGALQILFHGYIEAQGDIVISGHDHMSAIKSIIEEAENVLKKRNDNQINTTAGIPNKDTIYSMLGHKWRITTIEQVSDTERKVFLTCAPQCCTRPFHSKLEIMENDFINIPLDKL